MQIVHRYVAPYPKKYAAEHQTAGLPLILPRNASSLVGFMTSLFFPRVVLAFWPRGVQGLVTHFKGGAKAKLGDYWLSTERNIEDALAFTRPKTGTIGEGKLLLYRCCWRCCRRRW